MATDRRCISHVEWVEIVEPRTREHMYANLATGECVWDPPPGVPIKRTDDNQWWELFDQNTSRFYYYNASSQKTVWHRPSNCDIIPLAKLQTLKHNTEARDEDVKKESVGTQTSSTRGVEIVVNTVRPKTACVGTQTSPPSSPHKRHHRHSSNPSSPMYPPSSFSMNNHGLYHRDSGRSSDSSQGGLINSLECPVRKHNSSAESMGSLPSQSSPDQTWPTTAVPKLLGHSTSLQGVDSTPRTHRKHRSDGHCTPVSARRSHHWSRSTTDSNVSSPQSPIVPSSSSAAVMMEDSPLSDGSPHSVESHMSLDSQHLSSSPYLRVHSRGMSKSPLDSHAGGDPVGAYLFGSRPPSTHKSGNANETPTPLYSNLDYTSSLWEQRKSAPNASTVTASSDSQDNQFYLLPLQHYLLEQAKLSGYKFGDFLGDDLDSLSQSDDSEGHREEEDEFADDEGMSHPDSSSQEYLDDTRYLDEEEDYQLYCEAHHLPPDTQHGSLQRTLMHTSFLDKSQSEHGQTAANRPVSMMATCTTDSGLKMPRQPLNRKPPSESDIEKYAEDNINRHKKGIFRKKFTIRDMLAWSKDPISKPMILTTEKSLKRDACDMFKLIQMYMGDRKMKSGQTLDAVALDITTRGWSKSPLRDEIYIQICRQTTDNPKKESVLLGWELVAICVYFFPPSVKFQPYLESYIKRHLDCDFDTPEVQLSHYAQVCSKRLERMARTGIKKGLKKPTIEDIEQARIQIFRPSMFGNTLEEVLSLQKARFPSRKLPWIQTTLSEAVLRLNGTQTEGIFRVPGDIDEVNNLKARVDQWGEPTDEAQDPHVPASLLKLWYRELYEPLIPHDLYEECISTCHDPTAALAVINSSRLPALNRLVLTYLVHFLQLFSREENVIATKMDANNLAMVMAPNCLRCMSDDPRIIFENTRKEMAFMKLLIEHMDTSSVASLI